MVLAVSVWQDDAHVVLPEKIVRGVFELVFEPVERRSRKHGLGSGAAHVDHGHRVAFVECRLREMHATGA